MNTLFDEDFDHYATEFQTLLSALEAQYLLTPALEMGMLEALDERSCVKCKYWHTYASRLLADASVRASCKSA